MVVAGLTGGIGCGKSAVADLLVARGAWLLDADVVAREVVEPGRPAFEALVERFGGEIVGEDGTLDRPALAARAFGDPQALADLNAITHPAIGIEMIGRLEERRSNPGVAVVAIPLLRAIHRDTMRLDVVVVVDCPFEEAQRRLIEIRGMSAEDAASRIAAQPTREERLGDADWVVDNGGTADALDGEVTRLWEWLVNRPD